MIFSNYIHLAKAKMIRRNVLVLFCVISIFGYLSLGRPAIVVN